MCGIAGLVARRTPVTLPLLRAMTDRVRSRGPDSSGEWVGSDGQVGFGHRRLKIIDLTDAGHQPMRSACGRYTMVYNGEVYNFAALRTELEASGLAPAWRGHSDTEVMLAAFTAWGIRTGIQRFSGMFALAIWDERDRTLTLARDRFGEKPLYYGWVDAGFAFASTVQPFATTPGFANPVSHDAVACLMSRAYIPAPLSVYRRIFKLPPGCLLTVSTEVAATPSDAPHPAVERWFDYADQVLAGAGEQIADAEVALAELDTALTNAIERQLVADVPVGCFLSGGVDSSLITAIAQKCTHRPIKTFTIGFAEAAFDESPYARRVAEALGSNHRELQISARDALDVIPLLPAMYDEPFADSSQIATFLVSRMAREEVTVSLSGDAGDELFGGYNRHLQFPRLWRTMERLPRPLRAPAFRAAGAIPAGMWNTASDLARRRRSAWFGDNARRGLRLMAGAGDFDALFDRFMDDWSLDASPLADGSRCPYRLGTDPRLAHLPLEVQAMHADAVTYLPDDILAKVDRAGMAVSLESRIPFLDPEVTAIASRIAPSLKFANGQGKAILKRLLYSYVPRELIDRPKAGFAIPLSVWLRGPLRDWAEDLLSPAALAGEGLFDAAVVRARWQRHLAGQEDATQPLWSVLMYQAWRRGLHVTQAVG